MLNRSIENKWHSDAFLNLCSWSACHKGDRQRVKAGERVRVSGSDRKSDQKAKS